MAIDTSKFSIKLFAHESTEVRAEDIVPIFHAMIQQQSLANHLLIDVADYAHVPDGPGTLLVAREANIYLDRFDGKLGLTYSRKTPLQGDLSQRLAAVFAATFAVAAMLENQPAISERLRFATNAISVQINDRFAGPNTAETFTAIEPALKKIAAQLNGDSSVKVEQILEDKRRLFEVRVTLDAKPSLDLLQQRAALTHSAV